MSGYSQCKVSLSGQAVKRYITSIMRMKNDKGETFGDILSSAEDSGDQDIFGNAVSSSNYDHTKKDENNPLNVNIKDLNYHVQDGEILNIEARLPGDVVKDFFSEKLKGVETEYYGDTPPVFILTVADHDQSGNPVMEEYMKPDGERGQRPKTSIRIISYDHHTRGSRQVGEVTVVEEDIIKGALKETAEDMARTMGKSKAFIEKSLESLKNNAYGPAAGKMAGSVKAEVTNVKFGRQSSTGAGMIVVKGKVEGYRKKNPAGMEFDGSGPEKILD